MRAIRQRLPNCDVVYFGDIGNAPYGAKSQEELSLLTVRALERLRAAGATSLVSACNSVSASLAVSLFDALDLAPGTLIEMVGPTVSVFKDLPARLLLLATPATIRSGIYQNAFHMIGKEVNAVALPELAGALEFGAPEKDVEKIVADAIADTDLDSTDVVILACTHYPLAYETFRRLLPGHITICDPAFAVAERVERQFWPREAGEGRTRFLVSKDSEPFRALVTRFFPEYAAHIEVIE